MEQAAMGLVPQSKINEETMASLMSQREQSGISVKEFCKSHQMTEAAYYYWRRKLVNKKDRGLETQRAFTRLHFESETPNGLFCEMTTAAGGRLRFYQPVPASYLQSLL
jgi:transposase-like protein